MIREVAAELERAVLLFSGGKDSAVLLHLARKVDALERALRGTEAWITGIRREQSPTRASAEPIEWDESRGVWKFNPLVEWTDRDVWSYVNAHDLPYHPLHDRGYESIGCAPCTLPGSGREGRWAGQDKTECGLHV